MDECVSTLIRLQEVSSDLYEYQLKRIGTYQLPLDPEYKFLRPERTAELQRLANYISEYAFGMVNVRCERTHIIG
jgi:hypothetical protein